MRLTHHFLSPVLGAVLLTAIVPMMAEETIKVYTVPKEQPAGALTATGPAVGAASAMPAADIPVGSAHVTWTTPESWKELPPDGVRIGNFAIPGQDGAKAEAAIFSFPGAVGTELDNVNRWRNELQLPPIEQDKIVSQPVTVGSASGKLYEISGPSRHIVVATLARDGDMWFFKMRGDKDVVTDAEPVFRDFLKTIRFNAATNSPPPGAVESKEPAAAQTSSGSPKFTPPANWTEKSPGPMIFKAYSVAKGADKTASVTITFFEGNVGGTFANVNRWRRQVGLEPIAEDQLASVTHPLETTGGKATLVDFSGADARTSQATRLVAVEVPHGENTWFYKLMGDGAVVEVEKENFLKFVQSVRYP